MNLRHNLFLLLLSIFLAVGCAVRCDALEIVSPFPLVSYSSLGHADNGVLFQAVDSGGIFGGLRLAGTLRSSNPSTWASDALLRVDLDGRPGFDLQPFRTGVFSSLNADLSRRGFFWVATSVRMEAWELVDEPGADAVWDPGLRLEFSGHPTMRSGWSLVPGRRVFDLFGSSFDTQLAVYSEEGRVLASNDDAAGTEQSRVELDLEPGVYWVLVSGFRSAFFDGAAFGGSAGGWLRLAADGEELWSGDHPGGEVAGFRVVVVAEPVGAGVLAVGLVSLALRRRISGTFSPPGRIIR